eukprot:scaffold5214_cov51-Attheya_sp.AAC.2
MRIKSKSDVTLLNPKNPVATYMYGEVAAKVTIDIDSSAFLSLLPASFLITPLRPRLRLPETFRDVLPERPYKDDSTASRLLSEVKHLLARLVLRWGTTLESRSNTLGHHHTVSHHNAHITAGEKTYRRNNEKTT